MSEEKKSNKSIIIIVVIVVVIGGAIGAYFGLKGGHKTSNTNTTATKNTNTKANTNSDADPYASLMKYNNKIYTITSTDGKVSGRIGIKINTAWEMPIHAAYFFKIKDNLPKKATSFGGASYHYLGNNATAATLRQGSGTGTITPIYCNKDTMVNILDVVDNFSGPTEVYLNCDERSDPLASTDTFSHSSLYYYNKDNFSENGLFKNNKLAVFDGSPYYYEDATTGGYQLNSAKTISEGEITASYDLVFSE